MTMKTTGVPHLFALKQGDVGQIYELYRGGENIWGSQVSYQLQIWMHPICGVIVCKAKTKKTVRNFFRRPGPVRPVIQVITIILPFHCNRAVCCVQNTDVQFLPM